MKTSWRTTLMGIAALFVAIGTLGHTLSHQFDGDPKTVPDWDATYVALSSALAGCGLMFARDNKVTSKDLGL